MYIFAIEPVKSAVCTNIFTRQKRKKNASFIRREKQDHKGSRSLQECRNTHLVNGIHAFIHLSKENRAESRKINFFFWTFLFGLAFGSSFECQQRYATFYGSSRRVDVGKGNTPYVQLLSLHTESLADFRISNACCLLCACTAWRLYTRRWKHFHGILRLQRCSKWFGRSKKKKSSDSWWTA